MRGALWQGAETQRKGPNPMRFFAILLILAGALAVIGGIQGCQQTSPGGGADPMPFLFGLVSAIGFWAFAALMLGVAQIRDLVRRMTQMAPPPASQLTTVPDEPLAAGIPTRQELRDKHGAQTGEIVFTVLQQAAQRGDRMAEQQALDIARRVQSIRPR